MKKMKKALIIILTICMCTAYFGPIAVYADEAQTEEESVWDGSTTEAVMPIDDNYTVDTAPKLAWFAQQVNSGNNFDGKTVVITGNINLNSKYWTPIGKGTGASSIAGTIKIEYCTIKGLNTSNKYSGLFGNIKVQQFVVDNFKMENSWSCNSDWSCCVGTLIGRVEVAANGSMSILNSYFSGSTSNHHSFTGPTGGIIGTLVLGDSSMVTVNNIETHFQTNAGAQIGSLFAEVTDSARTGEIYISKVNTNDDLNGNTSYGYNNTYVGGLIGSLNVGSIYIDRVVINGKITSSAYFGYAGGLIGSASYKIMQVENVAVKSEINSSWKGVYGYVENAGGFLGYSGTTDSENSYIRNSYVAGKINDGVAFCSHCQSSSKIVRIENCYFDKDTTTVPANKFMCTGYADLFGISDANSKALSTTAMKQKESYNEWDFDHVWDIAENEYPSLRWLSGTEDDLSETEKQEYIQTHLDYINSDHYKKLIDDYCLQFQNKVFADGGEFIDCCATWKAVRFDIFDNPYDIVLADMILSEESAYAQKQSFELHLYSNQRKIINGVMELIDADGSLEFSDKTKLEKLFSEKDYSDTATYQLCEQLLYCTDPNKLYDIFKVYDKGNTVMDILGDGKDIVNAVIDVINYCSVLQAYNDTSDEFKYVLIYMDYLCTYETDYSYSDYLLDEAIMDYLSLEEEADFYEELYKKTAGSIIGTAWDIYEDTIINKTKKFLVGAMDLKSATTTVGAQGALGKANEVIAGLKVGYDVGVAFDSIFFNTDKVVDAYIEAYATAKTATYLRDALDVFQNQFLEKKDFQYAKLFCQTFGMYKNIQQNIVSKLISFYSENEKGLIKWLQGIIYVPDSEAQIYILQRDMINWQLANCHDPDSELVKKVKNITVSCPVDVEIFDDQNTPILRIVDNQIVEQSDNVCASIRNNIKYITIDDEKNYNVKITATDNGVMQYMVTSCDENNDSNNTIKFESINLQKDQLFSGKIYSGDNYNENAYALVSNDNIVESECKIFNSSSRVDISDIVLNAYSCELQEGKKQQIKSTVFPENASDKNVTWYSEDASVAKVDEYGNITAIKKGSTNLIVSD